MSASLCIASCCTFGGEIAAIVNGEGWNDVQAVTFPARCGRPPTTWDELMPLLPEDCSHLVVIGSVCIKGLHDPPAGCPPTRIVPLEQCFHLIAGTFLVNELIADSGYLLTQGWLEDWRGELQKIGFDTELAGTCLREGARELVLLDTGIAAEGNRRLAEMGQAVGMPVKRIPVGLDFTRMFVTGIVRDWRLEQDRSAVKERERRHAGELADHVSAVDMLTRLARTQLELEAIAVIKELFSMLFAPAHLYYLRMERESPAGGEPIPAEMHAAMCGLKEDYAWTPGGDGFLLRIAHGDTLLGVVAADRLAFPEYRERYLNMALAVTGVCGLAIDNARNRRRLLEAEKMASLGMLVAGVAHEINTPLGVVLTAATTLQDQSRRIAGRFSERSMTQSDLEHFLEAAGAGTRLVLQNMERISRLTDTFRQVAVDGKLASAQRFNFRDCLERLLVSLGNRLPADRISVIIDCDPDLEIESLADDWMTIFSNLVINSLQHGFSGKEQGIITIAADRGPKSLRVEYRDDGNGLSPEVLTRIFDPFFTTDLQHGMGLGMHLVYNIITHRLGGSITCESRTGDGAAFHIEVPL